MSDLVPGLGVGSGRYFPVMANFAVMLVHGPGWDSSRLIRDHGAWEEWLGQVSGHAPRRPG